TRSWPSSSRTTGARQCSNRSATYRQLRRASSPAHAGVAQRRRTGLRSRGAQARWGFESLHPHYRPREEPAIARQIDIRALGPMEVLVDDHPVALPGKRLRGLLAALLVRPRHVLTPDQLIEDVWGVRAHRTARASLHNLVSTLRRALLDSDCSPCPRRLRSG